MTKDELTKKIATLKKQLADTSLPKVQRDGLQQQLEQYQTELEDMPKKEAAAKKVEFSADDLLFPAMHATSASTVKQLKDKRDQLIKERNSLQSKTYYMPFSAAEKARGYKMVHGNKIPYDAAENKQKQAQQDAQIKIKQDEIDKLDHEIAAYNNVEQSFYNKSKTGPSATLVPGTNVTQADSTLAQQLNLDINKFTPGSSITHKDKAAIDATLQTMLPMQLQQVIDTAKDTVIQHGGELEFNTTGRAGNGNEFSAAEKARGYKTVRGYKIPYVADKSATGYTVTNANDATIQAYILTAAQSQLESKKATMSEANSSNEDFANKNNLTMTTVDKTNATSLGKAGALAYIKVLSAEDALRAYGNGSNVPASMQAAYALAKTNYNNAVTNYQTYVQAAQAQSDAAAARVGSAMGTSQQYAFADAVDYAYYTVLLHTNAYAKDNTDNAILQKKLDALPNAIADNSPNTQDAKSAAGV